MRSVYISGIGRTRTGRRPDVDHGMLVHEAVADAVADSGIDIDDIDAVVVGNMEIFEGIYLAHLDLLGKLGPSRAPVYRIDTGGATGGSVLHAARMLLLSGQARRVLAVGWEKHDNAKVVDVLNAFKVDLSKANLGAISGDQASRWLRLFSEERILNLAARIRVRAALGASRNEYAHLRKPLAEADVHNSPMLAAPTRLLHQCPESSGACAILLSLKNDGEKPMPVIDDSVVVRTAWGGGVDGRLVATNGSAMEVATHRIYQRNDISDPLGSLDLLEIYTRSVWDELDRTQHFLCLTEEETIELLETERTWPDGDIVINPSGGVLATNPVGAAGMLRTAEAALQLRGDAGEHQVQRPLRRALASTVGGGDWAVVQLLSIAT